MTMRLRSAPIEPHVLAEAAEVIRVLGHPVRLRIIECLEAGECSVSELQQRLRTPQAIVSQQLARMRAAGMVACRRDGSNRYYRVADERVVRMLSCLRNREQD